MADVKPDQFDQFVALIVNAPVPTIAAAAILIGLVWFVIHLIYASRISGFKERIEGKDEKLEWQKTQFDAEIDGLRRANKVLNDQIAQGAHNQEGIVAATRAALSETAKEILAEVERKGSLQISANPKTTQEALVSGNTASLSDQGFVNVRPGGDGSYFIVSPGPGKSGGILRLIGPNEPPKKKS